MLNQVPEAWPSGYHVHFDGGISLPEIDFSKVLQWLKDVVSDENGEAESVVYILTTDRKIHEINVAYLDHDEYTDIITFPYSYGPIETEIYISAERIQENARAHEVSFEDELKRVMVHGLLHMLGYNDKTAEEKAIMTSREDHHLNKA